MKPWLLFFNSGFFQKKIMVYEIGMKHEIKLWNHDVYDFINLGSMTSETSKSTGVTWVDIPWIFHEKNPWIFQDPVISQLLQIFFGWLSRSKVAPKNTTRTRVNRNARRRKKWLNSIGFMVNISRTS
jgi:hypothetical protein